MRKFKLSPEQSLPLGIQWWFDNFTTDEANVLFFGIGGGYDIYGVVNLFNQVNFKDVKYSEKTRLMPDYGAHTAHFANINQHVKEMVSFTEGTRASHDKAVLEAKMFNYVRNTEYYGMYASNVYALPRSGVKPLYAMLKNIVEENDITRIVLVDGGVDSLMHGDEDGTGTILEDTVSMIAALKLKLPTLLMCIGFGTEMEEGVCHYRALENIATLTKEGGFYGVQSIVAPNGNYGPYNHCLEEAWQDYRKSHIHTKVLSAARGKFGDDNAFDGVDAQVLNANKEATFISPLMNMIWYFDAEKVLAHNKLAKHLENTNTTTDVLMVYRQLIDQFNAEKRTRKSIPY